jgi:hypothetical protein
VESCYASFSVARDTPLTVFHKMLRTFTTEAPFFSVAGDTPLTVFHKMLRTFTTEAPFFSVARHTPLFCFAKCCGLSLLRRHFFQYYPDNNWVIALL